MDNNESKKSNSEFFSNVWNKTTVLSKKTADGISKGAKNLSEEAKKNAYEWKMKKYNPLFPEKFKSDDFKMPHVIEIVEASTRRDIDVCEGAIGWTDKVNDIEILHLYSEYVEESGLNLLPFSKCDSVYCIDNFDKSRFINSDTIFERITNEKLTELENIAYCLGAKSCSIEIVENTVQNTGMGVRAKTSIGGAEHQAFAGKQNSQSGKNVSYFDGHNNPQRPTLKWFAHDDNINALIEMRCSGNNSIKSKILEINCSSSATMSQKTACAIDKILKIKASVSMESKAIKEHSSKLIFDIEF